ncbi:hypothetical protein L6452_01982 [Arctium lappa]|uniref:Uncharacterized protein n=1 Tax=Arctium lappa TaxID=4217 RepID=A0ACB9FI48_ARCLA|nr:hypothetical protein L6452_01982 [Arctium lappa]
MYLTASRPDIMFSTCLCARFQAKPKESHLLAVKKIFRYIKGTPYLGLWYPKSSDYKLIAYSDADFGGNQLDRKSTSGHLQFLSDRLISWASKKQNCVFISTVEAKYVAAASCCAQVLWMKTQLRDYGMLYKTVPIYCDSKSAIAILVKLVQHTKTKHIDMRVSSKGCLTPSALRPTGLGAADPNPAIGGVKEIGSAYYAIFTFCSSSSSSRSSVFLQIDCILMASQTITDPMIQDENVIQDDPSDRASHETPMPSVRANLSAQRRTPNDVFPTMMYILPYKPNNYFVDFDKIKIHPVIRAILKGHPLAPALTYCADVPEVYLQHAWHTITKNERVRPHRFDLQINQFESFLSYKRLRLILELPEPNSRPGQTSYDSFPSESDVLEGIRNLGYHGDLDKVSQFDKSNLPPVWYALFSVLNRCLTSKHSGTDNASLHYLRFFNAVVYDLHVDFTYIFWTELSERVQDKLTHKKRKFLPFIRYMKLVVRILDTELTFIQRQKKTFDHSMQIPFDLIANYVDPADESIIQYFLENDMSLEFEQDEPSHDAQDDQAVETDVADQQIGDVLAGVANAEIDDEPDEAEGDDDTNADIGNAADGDDDDSDDNDDNDGDQHSLHVYERRFREPAVLTQEDVMSEEESVPIDVAVGNIHVDELDIAFANATNQHRVLDTIISHSSPELTPSVDTSSVEVQDTTEKFTSVNEVIWHMSERFDAQKDEQI